MHSTIKLAAVALFLIWGLWAPIVSAAEPAHEHGVSVLNVALEGKSLIIELESPGADIVGFEHAPKAERDKQAVRDAVATLRDGETLFQPAAGAACRLKNVDILSELMEHDPDRHEKQGHRDDQEAHAAFHVLYRFTCGFPETLTHMNLTYFRAFPGARELDAQIITASGQSAQELTASSSRLNF